MTLQLTCLGTADAFGTGGRHCAGYLVDSGEARVLLDAGPGILSALRGAGEDPHSIDAIALSHLHGDHFCGVAFLLLQGAIEERRRRALTILGPPGTAARVEALFAALYPSRAAKRLPFALRHVEVGDGDARPLAGFALRAFAVPHQRRELSLGFRVTAGGRSLVYSGDTAWTPDLLRHAAGAELFLCECTSFESRLRGHVSWRELEPQRQSFDCGRLLLTHLGREMASRARELRGLLARDGLRLAV